jgi:Ser/Thr protein kinase RdoA (MazF antagonist)
VEASVIGSEVSRAVTAARSIASSLGLRVDDAIVLHNSNKLTLRLRPCDVVARVAPVAQQALEFEIAIARRLAESESPVAALDPRVKPRVHLRDGFAVTLWTYYEPVGTPVPAADYADALRRLHAGMRAVDIGAPLATDRVASAQRIVASRDLSPALAEADRTLLADTLSRLGGVVGARTDVQLLHGEPHPGNVVATERGLVFVDLETCCRGPVEFDLAHAPDAVAEHYPGVDRDLLRDCRVLMLAMITAWRWDPDDQLPSGRQLAAEWLGQIKAARARPDQERLG